MKRLLLATALLLALSNGYSQKDTLSNTYDNKASEMMQDDKKLTIGGYGQVNYNQKLDSEVRYNGKLDVTRLVLLFGYKFSDKTQFISEIEYEHVNELYVEQAFLQHEVKPWLNLRAGLMLIPMGIVNEYHEPTTFNGTERPFIDNVISPSTWREIGVGLTGNVQPASLKYQLYLVNGFNGYKYDKTNKTYNSTLNGSKAFRDARQKGASSIVSSPNLAGKIEHYGIKGLNLGLSAYYGNTQSDLYDNKKTDAEFAKADSSVVKMVMLGLDARYQLKALHLRGQFYYTDISNTASYNTFTAVKGKSNDLGSAMQGYYVEASYNVFKHTNFKTQLIPFVRYEAWDTHFKTDGNLVTNAAYNQTAIVTGIGYKLTPGAVVKADMQWVKPDNAAKAIKQFNAGIGVMF